MFWKSTLDNYVHKYICEKLFTKTQSLNLALALQAHFLEWRLTRFGKELFIWLVFITVIISGHCVGSRFSKWEAAQLVRAWGR